MTPWALRCLAAIALSCALAPGRALADRGCTVNSTADEVAEGVDLHGQVALVTGGDSGLGFAAAEALAKRGATVVLASHNLAKAQAAADRLANVTSADVRALELDLSSLSSVRSCADQFTRLFGLRLNYLLNNAGTYDNKAALTADGFESVFETDYLGHFLLTELLLPALRQSRPARVVSVSSDQHEVACELAGLPAGCLKDFAYLPPPIIPLKNVSVGPKVLAATSYGIAKFALIEHAQALAEQEAGYGLAAFSLTPGYVNTSITIGDNVTQRCASQPPPNPCPYTPEQGAAMLVYSLLRAPSSMSGAYLSRVTGCTEHAVTTSGFTPDMRPKLYAASREWVKVGTVTILQ